MSKHERELASCEGKDPLTRPQAKALAKRQRRKKVKVEAYQCKICKQWHVGRPESAPPLHDGPRKVSPTPERIAKGQFQKIGGKAATARHIVDPTAHPIDELEWRKKISPEQADAGRYFEELYRAATETPGTRDSTTIWEPQGFESDDGNVKAVRERRELYLFLGTIRDRQLRRVCVDHTPPKHDGEIGILREALNMVAKFK